MDGGNGGGWSGRWRGWRRGCSWGRARGVPVSLLECLRLLDHRPALVLEEPLHERVRGAVSLVGGHWVVILNAGDSRGRARFTLAHEIGHVALGDGSGGEEGRVACAGGSRPREVLCDRFASELLVPAAALREAWGEGASVGEVARRFDVSEPVVEARVRRLGLV